MKEFESQYSDSMHAGDARFKLTRSSLWHLLLGGGEWYRVSKAITILRLVLLVDVSRWQGTIDFNKMTLSGVEGVIVKCGQGVAKDSRFDENWRVAKAARLPRGSYWFYDSRIAPKVQAYWWWTWIKDDPGELMHFADYEETYAGNYAGWQNFRIFLEEFKRLSNLPDSKIGIYTGYFYWISNSPTTASDLAFFARFRLWLAWYTDNPVFVIIPRPWTNATFILWQYGTPANGHSRGVESLEIDESNFNGDKESYRNYFRLRGPTNPPTEPTEGADMRGIVLLGYSLNIRPAAGGDPIGTLKVNDVVYGQVINNRIYYSKIYRAGGGVETLDGLHSSAVSDGATPPTYWMKLEAIPEPPPQEPPTVTLKHVIKVYNDGSLIIDDKPYV